MEQKEFGANCQLVSVEANQHNYGTFVDEVPATCKQEGELGHYHCDLCGKNFDVNKEELETIVIKNQHITLLMVNVQLVEKRRNTSYIKIYKSY